MSTDNLARFKTEINSFFVIILLNLVFGAMAMAFGILFIVESVTGAPGVQTNAVLRALTGVLAMVSFGLGFGWVLLSSRVLKGVTLIRREFRHHNGPVSDDMLTCWMVRMTAHYRGNRNTIRNMILICTLGGCCFLLLGVLDSLELYSLDLTSGSITLNGLSLIPAAVLTLGIAAVSLLSSYYFSKFSKVWDLREVEISCSEQQLAETLGRR